MFPLRTWSRKMPWNVTWVLESPKSTKRHFFFFYSTILQNEYTTTIPQNEEGRRFFFKQTLVWENKENVSIFQQLKVNSTSLQIITLSTCWGLCVIKACCSHLCPHSSDVSPPSIFCTRQPSAQSLSLSGRKFFWVSPALCLLVCWRLPTFFSNQKSGFLPVWLPYLSYHFLALFRN